MAQAHEYDAIVLDVMLPGIDGFETCRRLARRGRLVAGADADRARLGRGPGGRARHGRRRLPRQAVRVRRVARPAARAGPARRRGAADRARGRRPAPRSGRRARSGAGTARSRSRRRSSRSSRRSCAAPARSSRACTCSSTPGTSPTRTARTSSTSTSATCATKIDQPFGRRSLETVRGAGYRLRDGRRREPASDQTPRRPPRSRSRWRSCSRPRGGSSTHGWTLISPTALDAALQVRAQDLATLVRQPSASLAEDSGGRLVERGESFAQLLDRQGAVLDATQPLGSRVAPRPDRAAARPARAVFAEPASVPGLNEPVARCSRAPVERGGRRLVLVVGATRENDAETLRAFRDELLIAGPIALLLASLAGYFARRRWRCAPVEAMRRRAARSRPTTPGRAAPVPATRDELERLGATLNEMLGAARRRRSSASATSSPTPGHELRTPLALLRTELELALRHGRSPRSSARRCADRRGRSTGWRSSPRTSC